MFYPFDSNPHTYVRTYVCMYFYLPIMGISMYVSTYVCERTYMCMHNMPCSIQKMSKDVCYATFTYVRTKMSSSYRKHVRTMYVCTATHSCIKLNIIC